MYGTYALIDGASGSTRRANPISAIASSEPPQRDQQLRVMMVRGRVVRIQSYGMPELSLGAREVPLLILHRLSTASVCFREVAVDLKCTFGGIARRPKCRLGWFKRPNASQDPRVRRTQMSQRKVGRDLQGVVERVDTPIQVLLGALVPEVTTLEVGEVRSGVVRRTVVRFPAFGLAPVISAPITSVSRSHKASKYSGSPSTTVLTRRSRPMSRRDLPGTAAALAEVRAMTHTQWGGPLR